MTSFKFKTNIKCGACLATVTPNLNETAGEGKWEVNLNDPERTLTVQSETTEQEIEAAVRKAGFEAKKI